MRFSLRRDGIMSDTPTVNTELEQSLYRASSREKQLRRRAAASILAPVAVGALWFAYSFFEVSKLQSRAHTMRSESAALEQRTAEAEKKAAAAEQQRAEAEERAKNL